MLTTPALMTPSISRAIIVPQAGTVALGRTVLLAEDRVPGPFGLDHGSKGAFRGQIRLGDVRAIGLEADGEIGAVEPRHRLLVGGIRESESESEIIGERDHASRLPATSCHPTL
jgi:hypothetical protein